jgi:hypothetical protein
MSSRAKKKWRHRVDQLLAQPLKTPKQVSLEPHQAAVLLAASRLLVTLGVEADQLEKTYGQKEPALFLRGLRKQLGAWADDFAQTQGRRVLPVQGVIQAP